MPKPQYGSLKAHKTSPTKTIEICMERRFLYLDGGLNHVEYRPGRAGLCTRGGVARTNDRPGSAQSVRIRGDNSQRSDPDGSEQSADSPLAGCGGGLVGDCHRSVD